MFKGNVGQDSLNGSSQESDAARAERERLDAIMVQRIEEQRKRKAEEEANKSIFRRPGPAVSAEDLSTGPTGENDQRSAFAQSRTEKFLEKEIKPESSPFFESNQSNEKYVKYHDPSYRDMVWNGPYKRPPHPRQRHRCDYHLEDFLQTIVDKKISTWDTVKTYISCLRSNPGEEPPRLRREVWRLRQCLQMSSGSLIPIGSFIGPGHCESHQKYIFDVCDISQSQGSPSSRESECHVCLACCIAGLFSSTSAVAAATILALVEDPDALTLILNDSAGCQMLATALFNHCASAEDIQYSLPSLMTLLGCNQEILMGIQLLLQEMFLSESLNRLQMTQIGCALHFRLVSNICALAEKSSHFRHVIALPHCGLPHRLAHVELQSCQEELRYALLKLFRACFESCNILEVGNTSLYPLIDVLYCSTLSFAQSNLAARDSESRVLVLELVEIFCAVSDSAIERTVFDRSNLITLRSKLVDDSAQVRSAAVDMFMKLSQADESVRLALQTEGFVEYTAESLRTIVLNARIDILDTDLMAKTTQILRFLVALLQHSPNQPSSVLQPAVASFLVEHLTHYLPDRSLLGSGYFDAGLETLSVVATNPSFCNSLSDDSWTQVIGVLSHILSFGIANSSTSHIVAGITQRIRSGRAPSASLILNADNLIRAFHSCESIQNNLSLVCRYLSPWINPRDAQRSVCDWIQHIAIPIMQAPNASSEVLENWLISVSLRLNVLSTFFVVDRSIAPVIAEACNCLAKSSFMSRTCAALFVPDSKFGLDSTCIFASAVTHALAIYYNPYQASSRQTLEKSSLSLAEFCRGVQIESRTHPQDSLDEIISLLFYSLCTNDSKVVDLLVRPILDPLIQLLNREALESDIRIRLFAVISYVASERPNLVLLMSQYLRRWRTCPWASSAGISPLLPPLFRLALLMLDAPALATLNSSNLLFLIQNMPAGGSREDKHNPGLEWLNALSSHPQFSKLVLNSLPNEVPTDSQERAVWSRLTNVLLFLARRSSAPESRIFCAESLKKIESWVSHLLVTRHRVSVGGSWGSDQNRAYEKQSLLHDIGFIFLVFMQLMTFPQLWMQESLQAITATATHVGVLLRESGRDNAFLESFQITVAVLERSVSLQSVDSSFVEHACDLWRQEPPDSSSKTVLSRLILLQSILGVYQLQGRDAALLVRAGLSQRSEDVWTQLILQLDSSVDMIHSCVCLRLLCRLFESAPSLVTSSNWRSLFLISCQIISRNVGANEGPTAAIASHSVKGLSQQVIVALNRLVPEDDIKLYISSSRFILDVTQLIASLVFTKSPNLSNYPSCSQLWLLNFVLSQLDRTHHIWKALSVLSKSGRLSFMASVLGFSDLFAVSSKSPAEALHHLELQYLFSELYKLISLCVDLDRSLWVDTHLFVFADQIARKLGQSNTTTEELWSLTPPFIYWNDWNLCAQSVFLLEPISTQLVAEDFKKLCTLLVPEPPRSVAQQSGSEPPAPLPPTELDEPPRVESDMMESQSISDDIPYVFILDDIPEPGFRDEIQPTATEPDPIPKTEVQEQPKKRSASQLMEAELMDPSRKSFKRKIEKRTHGMSKTPTFQCSEAPTWLVSAKIADIRRNSSRGEACKQLENYLVLNYGLQEYAQRITQLVSKHQKNFMSRSYSSLNLASLEIAVLRELRTAWLQNLEDEDELGESFIAQEAQRFFNPGSPFTYRLNTGTFECDPLPSSDNGPSHILRASRRSVASQLSLYVRDAVMRLPWGIGTVGHVVTELQRSQYVEVPSTEKLRASLENQVRKILQELLDEDTPIIWISGKTIVHKNFRATIRATMEARQLLVETSSAPSENHNPLVSSGNEIHRGPSTAFLPDASSTENVQNDDKLHHINHSVEKLCDIDGWIETRPV